MGSRRSFLLKKKQVNWIDNVLLLLKAGFSIDDLNELDIRDSKYICKKVIEDGYKNRVQFMLDLADAVRLANISTMSHFKNGHSKYERWHRKMEGIIDPDKKEPVLWNRFKKRSMKLN